MTNRSLTNALQTNQGQERQASETNQERNDQQAQEEADLTLTLGRSPLPIRGINRRDSAYNHLSIFRGALREGILITESDKHA